MTRRLFAALVLIGIVCAGTRSTMQGPAEQAELHFQVALRALLDQNHRVALDELYRAIALKPEHALAHYHLSKILQQSSPREALTHLDRAVQIGLPEAETKEALARRVELLYEAARKRAREVHTDASGLTWTIRDNGDDIDWKAANAYCANLELADFNDWRLPTIQELATMSNRRALGPYKIHEPIVMSACCSWSATKQSGKHVVYAFNFGEEWPYDGPAVNVRALCVRRDPVAQAVKKD